MDTGYPILEQTTYFNLICLVLSINPKFQKLPRHTKKFPASTAMASTIIFVFCSVLFYPSLSTSCSSSKPVRRVR